MVHVARSYGESRVLLRAGSRTAWCARIRSYGPDGEPAAIPEQELHDSFGGVREVFRHGLIAALGTNETGQDVGSEDLAVSYLDMGLGDYALWFDIRDRRSRAARWLSPKVTWEAAVELLIGEASRDIVALLRATAMGVFSNAEGLMIRPVPGPDGMQSRGEISLPGQPAARLDSTLWDWSRSPQGLETVREMFAALRAAEVAYVEVILYAGSPQEKTIRLDATPGVLNFIQGAEPGV